MPTCRFRFIYKDTQYCVLGGDCTHVNPADQLACELFHSSSSILTPQDIEFLKKKLISKLEDIHSPLTSKTENPPPEKH